jgi:hypothetical protein
MEVSTSSHRPPADSEPELSPLEQEVLDEYAKLVGNLDNASSSPPPIHQYQSNVSFFTDIRGSYRAS